MAPVDNVQRDGWQELYFEGRVCEYGAEGDFGDVAGSVVVLASCLFVVPLQSSCPNICSIGVRIQLCFSSGHHHACVLVSTFVPSIQHDVNPK